MRRIMYVENKAGGLNGEGRIGWVESSKTGRTYRYRGRELLRVGNGYKYKCVDLESDDVYWVSGPRKDGARTSSMVVSSTSTGRPVEYWTKIRQRPSGVALTEYRAGASTRTGGTTRRNERRAQGMSGSR